MKTGLREFQRTLSGFTEMKTLSIRFEFDLILNFIQN